MTELSPGNPSAARQWQTQQERGNPFLLNLLTWVALHLGRRMVFVWLSVIVFYYFLFARNARNASRNFLQRVHQHTPGWREVYHHLLTFAQVAMDRIYFLAGRETEFDVHIHGNALFDEYKKRGCFLLTAHIGSFDAMRVMGMGRRSDALPIRILLDIQHNANIMRLLQKLDPQLAAGVIDARTPAPALALILSEAIEQGHLIGIMADRCARGERSATLDFLGASAEFPAGIWQLAALLKAPVISCFGIYSGANRYDLYFELISEQLGTNREDRAEAISAGMTRYVARLEDLVRKHPYNWFNFYDFWQDESTAHH
jgi:predicted LPLAT superfamily acyltransferase